LINTKGVAKIREAILEKSNENPAIDEVELATLLEKANS
jgi:hypothetical protein